MPSRPETLLPTRAARASDADAAARPAPRGRPRGFDAVAALEAAALQFWQHGYAATSLDALTAAMGLSRSSLYAAYGSKRAVMLAALTLYGERLLVRLAGLGEAAPTPREAVAAVVRGIACTDWPDHGCLFVNTVAELAPQDAAVRTFARGHLDRVAGLLTCWLRHAGLAPADARRLARSLAALATGATTLRKAGLPDRAIETVLAEAGPMVEAALGPGRPGRRQSLANE